MSDDFWSWIWLIIIIVGIFFKRIFVLSIFENLLASLSSTAINLFYLVITISIYWALFLSNIHPYPYDNKDTVFLMYDEDYSI